MTNNDFSQLGVRVVFIGHNAGQLVRENGYCLFE